MDTHHIGLRGWTSLHVTAWASNWLLPTTAAASLASIFGVIAARTCFSARARAVVSQKSCQSWCVTMEPRLRFHLSSLSGWHRLCCVQMLALRASASTQNDSGRIEWAKLSIARSPRSSRTLRGTRQCYEPNFVVALQLTSTKAAVAPRRTFCGPTISTRSPRSSRAAPASTTSTTGSASGTWGTWWPRTARWPFTATSCTRSATGSTPTSRWRSTVQWIGSPRRSRCRSPTTRGPTSSSSTPRRPRRSWRPSCCARCRDPTSWPTAAARARRRCSRCGACCARLTPARRSWSRRPTSTRSSNTTRSHASWSGPTWAAWSRLTWSSSCCASRCARACPRSRSASSPRAWRLSTTCCRRSARSGCRTWRRASASASSHRSSRGGARRTARRRAAAAAAAQPARRAAIARPARAAAWATAPSTRRGCASCWRATRTRRRRTRSRRRSRRRTSTRRSPSSSRRGSSLSSTP